MADVTYTFFIEMAMDGCNIFRIACSKWNSIFSLLIAFYSFILLLQIVTSTKVSPFTVITFPEAHVVWWNIIWSSDEQRLAPCPTFLRLLLSAFRCLQFENYTFYNEQNIEWFGFIIYYNSGIKRWWCQSISTINGYSSHQWNFFDDEKYCITQIKVKINDLLIVLQLVQVANVVWCPSCYAV